MNSAISPVNYEQLSPDLRWQLEEKQRRLNALLNWASRGVAIALIAPVVIPPLNTWLQEHLPKKDKAEGTTYLATAFSDEVEEGEVIDGYEVTSGYGLRESPCPGCSSDHRGVDLATPVGTTLYAPAAESEQVTVSCWNDDGGGGLVADIEPGSAPGLKFQALHLEHCSEGVHAGGEAIAQTGSSGNGTGPHLDWRQRDRATDQHQHPVKGWLAWALTGAKPISPMDGDLLVTIKSEEGLRLCAYLDPVGVPTIGYGTTAYPDGSPIQMGQCISEQEANELMEDDLAQARDAAKAKLQVEVSDQQLDALASAAYNLGSEGLNPVFEKMNQGDVEGAAESLRNHDHGMVNGVMVKLPGLTKRRETEAQMLMQG